MKIHLHKYILYSSVFAIFTESFFFHYIIDWKLFYIILLINFYLLSRIKKITINKYVFFLIVGLITHGLIMNALISIPLKFLFAQIIGVFIVSTYYYNFVSLFNVSKIIELYSKYSLYIAAIGYPMLALGINSNDGVRLQSIFKEPAHFAIVVIPACYYYLKQKKYLPFLIIFGSLILSQSSLGYIGCGLMFIIPNFNRKRILYLLATVPFIISISYVVYKENELVKLRVDDTLSSFNSILNGKFKEETNLSTYAFLSNLFVTKCNIQEHPLGSGLGSHFYMHTTIYHKNIRPPEYIKMQRLDNINAADANSLLLRIVSDLGIIGILFLIFVLVYLIKPFSSKDFIFAQGIVIYILLKLFRDGHYFPPELYFFIFILYFTIQERQLKENQY